MLFWCLLGIAGTKLAALELLLAPSCCRCCPVEALCSTRLFARRLHPKQAEYGIFNCAQKCIQYSLCLWKNKPLKGMVGRESACLQREDLSVLEGRDVFASLSGGRCPAEQGVIISALHPHQLLLAITASKDPTNLELSNRDGVHVAKRTHLPDVWEMSNISLTLTRGMEDVQDLHVNSQ